MAVLAFVVIATITLLWSEQREPALREWRTMIVEPAIFYLLLRTVRLTNRDVGLTMARQTMSHCFWDAAFPLPSPCC
jgi:hypothetical protein